jgi:hypothetical protein
VARNVRTARSRQRPRSEARNLDRTDKLIEQAVAT